MTKINWEELEKKEDKTNNEKVLLEFKEFFTEMTEIVNAYNDDNYSSGESAMNGIVETVNNTKHLL